MPILQISTTYKNKLINYIIKKGKMQRVRKIKC